MASSGEVLTLYAQAYIQTLHSVREPLSSAVYEQAESNSWTLGEKAESENLRERKLMASTASRSQPVLFSGACCYPRGKQLNGSQVAHATALRDCRSVSFYSLHQAGGTCSSGGQGDALRTSLTTGYKPVQEIRNLETDWFLSTSTRNSMKCNTEKRADEKSCTQPEKVKLPRTGRGPPCSTVQPLMEEEITNWRGARTNRRDFWSLILRDLEGKEENKPESCSLRIY